jgi:hypothetical protein
MMMQTSAHLPCEDTARELGAPAYTNLSVNLPFLTARTLSIARFDCFILANKNKDDTHYGVVGKDCKNGVAGNRTQNLLHSVMLEEQC